MPNSIQQYNSVQVGDEAYQIASSLPDVPLVIGKEPQALSPVIRTCIPLHWITLSWTMLFQHIKVCHTIRFFIV